jgi:hypothetical protein
VSLSFRRVDEDEMFATSLSAIVRASFIGTVDQKLRNRRRIRKTDDRHDKICQFVGVSDLLTRHR